MKYIELFESEFLTDKDEILGWMEESFLHFDPTNLTINFDGLIYDGDLSLKTNVSKIKVKFKSISGEFVICMNSDFTSLEGCPGSIVGDFHCYETSITSLKYGPKVVTGNYNCRTTGISNLEGCPKEIGGYFNCSDTNIITLEECPQIVGDNFICYKTNITSLKFCPQKVDGYFSCHDIGVTDPKEYRYALYCEISGNFNSGFDQINKIINTYKGSANRKHWASAINLLSKVQL